MKLFGSKIKWSNQEIAKIAALEAEYYWQSEEYQDSEQQDPESIGIAKARGATDNANELAQYALVFGDRVRSLERRYEQDNDLRRVDPKF